MCAVVRICNLSGNEELGEPGSPFPVACRSFHEAAQAVFFLDCILRSFILRNLFLGQALEVRLYKGILSHLLCLVETNLSDTY